ncbi:MAG: hypothetical protein AAF593_05190 [Planctomycetota bacterium]
MIVWAGLAWAAPAENFADDAAQPVPNLVEIRKLPIGLEVSHNPHPVYAMEKGRSGFAYTWLYQTKVKATEKPLQIVEFGAFIRDGNRWVFGNYTGKPFTPEDFADWYSCQDANLELGEVYADPLNWSGSDKLRESLSIWYYIAEDAEGNRYYGEAPIQQLAELRDPGEAI